MKLQSVKTLIYLSAEPQLPAYLDNLRGVLWHFSRSATDVRQFLGTVTGEIFVVVKSPQLSLRMVEAFLSWTQLNKKLNFIFIAQTIEKTVHQMALNHPQMLVVFASEGARITHIMTQRLMGVPVKSRKRERQFVQVQVVLQPSHFTHQGSSGSPMPLLGEGQMQDFSQGGAQICLRKGGVRPKDFVKLMYRDHRGEWVAVESQVRWVATASDGQEVLGVQFLAVSA